MAYSNPPTWSHGGVNVSAARMNIYSDDLNYLYAAIGDENHVVRETTGAETSYLVNVWRWLWYATQTGSTGTIGGGSTPVSLPDTAGVMTAYDLSRVSWLTPGQVYTVTGVIYAAEDQDA